MSKKLHDDLFPPTKAIKDFIKSVRRTLEETPFWQYYDTGLFGKLHQIIFRTRYKALHDKLAKLGVKPKHVLDVGCGCMLIAFGLLTKFDLEYVGLDILPSGELQKYAALISKTTGKNFQVVRASAKSLPFRKNLFNLVLAFDVLEHLENPKDALIAPIQSLSDDGLFVVSVPMENLFHRFARIFGGAMIGKPWRIGQRSPHHYASDVSSYEQLVRCLCKNYEVLQIVYTPVGLAPPLNINAILFCSAKPKNAPHQKDLLRF